MKQKQIMSIGNVWKKYDMGSADPLIVLKEIIPSLPREERFDLVDQMRRCCKTGPSLIAEGFAKRYQVRQWKKYLRDTIGESYEMINHLSVCIDVYGKYVDVKKCRELINLYEVTCKQITKLIKSWQDYHDRKSF